MLAGGTPARSLGRLAAWPLGAATGVSSTSIPVASVTMAASTRRLLLAGGRNNIVHRHSISCSSSASSRLPSDVHLLLATTKHQRCSSSSSSAINTTTSSAVTRSLTTSAMASAAKTLTLDNMNQHIKTMEYAVRGPIVIRAVEIEKELEQGVKKPFKEVIRANIGDCHSLGQKPITFMRQVLAICSYPELLNSDQFTEDVKERARHVLHGCKGSSVGSYSDSAGVEVVRRDVAKYIEERDGFPASFEDITLCAGASEGIRSVMKLLNQPKGDKLSGIMIPIPQYPLYTASIAEFGMYPVSYYLDESKNWALGTAELKRSIKEARQHCDPRGIVVINPGNPTGQVLTKENIQDIIKFAHEEKLFLFADEVYQHNVYAEGSQFHSFKKVAMEMGAPYNGMELASFMSTSKGYMGECGLRGGYSEVINLDPAVKAMLNKSISAKLCPTVLGQVTLETVVNPPRAGEPSYDRFAKEKDAVLAQLAERAKMVADAFNSVEGMSCNVLQGAMYAFPQVILPPRAIETAKKNGVEPDMLYVMELLEDSGICVVPGSGFGQVPGTYHFRTTILPPTDKLQHMLDLFKNFHLRFLKKYA